MIDWIVTYKIELIALATLWIGTLIIAYAIDK